MMRTGFILAFALCLSVHAEEVQKKTDGETAMKMEEAAGTKNKVPGDIDEEVTNPKLRADSGSKSKWSISNTWSYAGGSLSNAFGAQRPNLSGQPGQLAVSSLNTGLGGRYRWNKNDSATFGTTFGILTPFQGHIDSRNNQTTVNDPSIGYSHAEKMGEIQVVTGVGYAYGTSVNSVDIHETHQLGAFLNAMHAWQNRFSAGLSFGTDYYFFNDSPASDPKDSNIYKANFYGNDKRTQWDLNMYPIAEYKFSDTYSFRTVFGYFNWKHLYGDGNHYRMLQQYVYQQVGVLISITRDIYLNPYIKVVPGDLRSDFTNVSMTATINVF